MMDSFSITTDCIQLGNTISKALLVLNDFVREVRESRSSLDAVSRELHSLQTVLVLLKEDAGTLPSKLAAHTPAVLEQCNILVGELDSSLLALDNNALSKAQKRTQWISVGRHRMTELRASLEAYRGILGLAMDLVGTTSGRQLHDSTEQGDYDSIENEQQRAEVRTEVVRVMEEMQLLQQRLPGEFGYDGSNFALQTYYVVLKIYAKSLMNGGSECEDMAAFMGVVPVLGIAEEGSRKPDVGDMPDSAIEVSDVSSTSVKQAFDDQAAPAPSIPRSRHRYADPYTNEVSQLMNDMNMEDDDDDVDADGTVDEASRPPTPPPKDDKRLERLESRRRTMCSPFELLDTDNSSIVTEHMRAYGVVTSITSEGRKKSLSKHPPPSRSSRFLGRVFPHMKNSLSASDASVTSGSTTTEVRPETPIIQASLVRRGSRRLSTSIKRLPLWTTELEEPDGPPSPGSNAIFGVSLQKSMQAAKGTVKTHHSGSGSSRRDFPLCIHKCSIFIQNEGIEAPDIFAEPGDGYRVQKLKQAFSRPPTYGEDISWDNYGVYDAADIISLFLTQLPKPLVSESVAKRWISLSKQATLSGSHATRLDQCIDFWEEALGGMRGPSRSLFKLLLNLWSEIADAAEKNDMTAERLAQVLLKPLMHTSSGKYSTDFMLGLAFLIRKRSEYTMMLNEGRKSRAAFEK